MIQRVYEQSLKSAALAHVVVATDDFRIYDHVIGFGGQSVMTSVNHNSGTERCREALQKLSEDYDYVINIQGDEPFIQPSQIDSVASLLEEQVEIASLVMHSKDAVEREGHDVVYVVFNRDMNALYFSRVPIPYKRSDKAQEMGALEEHHLHIGIYGYSVNALNQITDLKASELEQLEGLEQLRWLDHGYQIKLGITHIPSFGVDRPRDVEFITKRFLV